MPQAHRDHLRSAPAVLAHERVDVDQAIQMRPEARVPRRGRVADRLAAVRRPRNRDRRGLEEALGSRPDGLLDQVASGTIEPLVLLIAMTPQGGPRACMTHDIDAIAHRAPVARFEKIARPDLPSK